MMAWIINNAATIVISVVLSAVVFFIVRGMVRGEIKSCDCGSCAASDGPSGCAACPFSGNCGSHGKQIS